MIASKVQPTFKNSITFIAIFTFSLKCRYLCAIMLIKCFVHAAQCTGIDLFSLIVCLHETNKKPAHHFPLELHFTQEFNSDVMTYNATRFALYSTHFVPKASQLHHFHSPTQPVPIADAAIEYYLIFRLFHLGFSTNNKQHTILCIFHKNWACGKNECFFSALAVCFADESLKWRKNNSR